MEEDPQNPNEEVPDFSHVFDKTNALDEAPPAQADNNSPHAIKRPVLTVAVASIIVLVAVVVVVSLLNSLPKRGQVKPPPLATPPVPGETLAPTK